MISTLEDYTFLIQAETVFSQMIKNRFYLFSACKVGYYGLNCEDKCPSPYFGQRCKSECNCTENSCHHVYGCELSQEGMSYYSFQFVLYILIYSLMHRLL